MIKLIIRSEKKGTYLNKKKNILFQPDSVKERDRTLKTPLHYCAENKNISCADAVLKAYPELVNAQDENGYCPLHLGVIAGNRAIIKFLLRKGAKVNLQDYEGHSAVHWAVGERKKKNQKREEKQ